MITENQEYKDCMDKLKAINYLMEATACATNGDDVQYAQTALFFLAEEMSKAITGLESLQIKPKADKNKTTLKEKNENNT